jgi:hypothetical protein
MPFVDNPICYICKKIHPKDTTSIIQLIGPGYENINVCDDHKGIKEEKIRQDSLTGKEKEIFDRNVFNAPGFQSILKGEIRRMKQRELEYLERCRKEGKTPYGGQLEF